ncbi:hypothetical protein GCM10023178_30500 [Actinomadura luteofluorescens]
MLSGSEKVDEEEPVALRTPVTVKRIPPTSIFLPIGFTRPNRSDATVLPSTTVLRAAATSAAVNAVPDARVLFAAAK